MPVLDLVWPLRTIGCIVAVGLGKLLVVGVVFTIKGVPSADGFGVGIATVGVDPMAVGVCPVAVDVGTVPGCMSRTVPRLPTRRRMILVKTAMRITVERFCAGAVLGKRGKDCCTGGIVIGLEAEREC